MYDKSVLYSITILISLASLSLGEITFKQQTDFYKSFDDRVNFYAESGYAKIEDEQQSNNYMFYQLILKQGTTKLEDVKETDNFILWLTGGPGCSSQMDFLKHIGPFIPYKTDENNYSLKWVDDSWNELAHVLYVDQPFNAGFSYSDSKTPITNIDEGSKYLLKFLELFYQAKPQMIKPKFYIFGSSYGGHFVPGIAAEIIRSGLDQKLNFIGVGHGNGYTDPETINASYASMLFSIGIIDQKKAEEINGFMTKSIQDILNKEYAQATIDGSEKIFNFFYNEAKISPYNFQDYTEFDPTQIDDISLFYDSHKKQYNAPDNLVYRICNSAIGPNYIEDFSVTQKPNVEFLLNQGKKVLIYNGSIDLICNTPGVNSYITKLRWDGINQWKNTPKMTWKFDGKTVGTVKSYEQLTFVTIYLSGHDLSGQPLSIQKKMLNQFLNGGDWD